MTPEAMTQEAMKLETMTLEAMAPITSEVGGKAGQVIRTP